MGFIYYLTSKSLPKTIFFMGLWIAVYLTIFMIQDHLKKRKESKENSSSESKKKSKMDEFLEELQQKSSVTWEEIFKVFHSKDARHPIIIHHLPTMSLLDIVKISHLKRQIVWGNDHLNLALFILEENIKTEFDDDTLSKYLRLLEELLKTACNASTSSYKGSKSLFSKIQSECPKGFELLAEDLKIPFF